jgi:peptidoglycan hydrolase-like protein with peptidoglycan-binding domain
MSDPVVFSGLTKDQADATAAFYRARGLVADVVADGPNLFSVRVSDPPAGPVGGAGGGPARLLMRLAPAGYGHVHGPLVMALQLALAKSGQAVDPDGDFGKLTTTALERWQAANGITQADSIDTNQWQILTGLKTPSIFDLCINLTSDFEGTSFDRVVGNFDGAGITFGLIGFTLVNGELKALLTAIEALKSGVVADAFGALYTELMTTLDLPKADRVKWADNISTGPKKYNVVQSWQAAFQRLGSHPEARRAQIQRAYEVYWTTTKQYIARFMGARAFTDLDVAFWFDTAVQSSMTDAKVQALKEAASSAANGADLRQAFAEAIASNSSSQWRADVRSRKTTFVNGQGTVHGSNYSLAFWGFSNAPVSALELDAPSSIIDVVSAGATAWNDSVISTNEEPEEKISVGTPEVVTTGASPHAAWPLYAQFSAYVATLGLRNFGVDELLFLGSQNAAGKCQGLNDYPPQSLWTKIGPTAAILDKLRDDLAAPIYILSAYRAPPYNACLDGTATNSFHMRFQALDFVCDTGTPSDWASRLRNYRSRGLFKGGIGTYRTFVHVDTRGYNADWTG